MAENMMEWYLRSLFPSIVKCTETGKFGAENRNVIRNQICKRLKGQCHEIFCFGFFSWITFPQAPENNIRVISNFFENSQFKVHHRCQRKSFYAWRNYVLFHRSVLCTKVLSSCKCFCYFFNGFELAIKFWVFFIPISRLFEEKKCFGSY